MNDIEPIMRLVNQLSRLPGIGRKTAARLAYHIIALPEDQVRELAVSIFNGKKQVHFCPVCGDYTDQDPCKRCADPARDKSILCVVKDPRDVAAMERMRDFNGLYHVLHGVISPMDGVGPATAAYIARLLKPLVRVTRIAHGVPVGGELENTDEVTLSKAFENRREL